MAELRNKCNKNVIGENHEKDFKPIITDDKILILVPKTGVCGIMVTIDDNNNSVCAERVYYYEEADKINRCKNNHKEKVKKRKMLKNIIIACCIVGIIMAFRFWRILIFATMYDILMLELFCGESEKLSSFIFYNFLNKTAEQKRLHGVVHMWLSSESNGCDIQKCSRFTSTCKHAKEYINMNFYIIYWLVMVILSLKQLGIFSSILGIIISLAAAVLASRMPLLKVFSCWFEVKKPTSREVEVGKVLQEAYRKLLADYTADPELVRNEIKKKYDF